MIQKFLYALIFAAFSCAVVAQEALPAKMKGRWQDTSKGHSGEVEVELVRMNSPTEATIRVAWWRDCPWGETKAKFENGIWKFSPTTCTQYSYFAKLRPVEGKSDLKEPTAVATTKKSIWSGNRKAVSHA